MIRNFLENRFSKNDLQFVSCTALFRILQGIWELIHFLNFKMQSKEMIMKKNTQNFQHLCSTINTFEANTTMKPASLQLLWVTLLQLYQKRPPAQMCSSEFYKMFWNTFFKEHLHVTASLRIQWRLSTSLKQSKKSVWSHVFWYV